MKIQDEYGDVVDVFGIYWNSSNGRTYFFGLTPTHTGSFAYDLDEVTVIDPSVKFRTHFLSGSLNGVYHQALIENNLLDELIDCNLEVREQFLEIVRSEGVIDW